MPRPFRSLRSPRSLRTLRPQRDDTLIGLTGLCGGLLAWALGLQGGWPPLNTPGVLALIPLTVISAAELLRRTAPRTALAAGTVALVLDSLAGTLIPTVLMFTDLVYAAVLYGSPALSRRLPRITVLLTVLAILVPLVTLRMPESLFIGIAIGLITVGPAFTGVLVRDHRDEAAAERLRAEQTALLAEMDRAQAVNAERARMARELHDMVANHLSAIAIHSTAALSLGEAGNGNGTRAGSSAAAVHDALGVIRENSVQGLTEMRRLIGILRDAEDADEPAAASPTLDSLDVLLTRARATAAEDFTFTLLDERTDAAPDTGAAARPLPAPVELAAYRVVQESLTNTLKHASPGTVTVHVRRTDDRRRSALVVRVTSPLDGTLTPRAPGSSTGLIGMRERVELLRGTLETGPVTGPDGGKRWEVRAELPMEEQ